LRHVVHTFTISSNYTINANKYNARNIILDGTWHVLLDNGRRSALMGNEAEKALNMQKTKVKGNKRHLDRTVE